MCVGIASGRIMPARAQKKERESERVRKRERARARERERVRARERERARARERESERKNRLSGRGKVGDQPSKSNQIVVFSPLIFTGARRNVTNHGT